MAMKSLAACMHASGKENPLAHKTTTLACVQDFEVKERFCSCIALSYISVTVITQSGFSEHC